MVGMTEFITKIEMAEDFKFTARKNSSNRTSINYVGGSGYNNRVVARGKCPFCAHSVAFRQLTEAQSSDIHGRMVPVRCDGCKSVISISVTEEKMHPGPKIEGIEGLPSPIQDYYKEALRCIASDAPNGATTLFRKLIHAISIHYDIAEVDDNMSNYKMVKRLHEEGHINEKLKQSLLATKDIGNDGAHINENEPDIEQAIAIKGLIDAVLNSTIKTDQNIEFAREKHPNPHAESKDN